MFFSPKTTFTATNNSLHVHLDEGRRLEAPPRFLTRRAWAAGWSGVGGDAVRGAAEVSVVYLCGPLDTFLNIMKLFQREISDPENYAIFYLDVFAESLTERRPWRNSDPDWADPISVFKVP
ncbi:Atrial natriuretic peptide receptor 2 [Liparis tanakae]|uniref:Atrial natriuretic peptide receptor 2 n=1 Tax=Liparis tanakae TaxID=230148 RepID=A0A4Z2E071_9TELE|nr:Atrial natriuretic peptide receptor 2 [Liparis tanakae]